MIHGNIEGIRDSILDQLEELYSFQIDKSLLVSNEVANRLCHYTQNLNREIAVYINRKGRILDITVGNYASVSLSLFESERRGDRLSGIRCIHTHPNSNGNLSSIDINSLINLKLDAMAAIGVKDGKITNMYCAFICGDNKECSHVIKGPFLENQIENNALMQFLIENDKKINNSETFENQEEREVAILVGLDKHIVDKDINKTTKESLEELELLAETVGAVVVDKILQTRQRADSAFFIGKGKAEEIALLRQKLNANLIIFDDELSGAQIRNLEQTIGTKVIDRTTLILDIFAQRAKSKEGKIQVELAQLKYRLPRLMGMGHQLSRLGGGIGTRGPGEKKLEVDRRHIHRRIKALEDELREIKKQRVLQRVQRTKNKISTVALVGYTNSGKSTLMNSLSYANVLAEDKLFATLDPTIRKIILDNGQEILLIDTVGFIRKLPHHLVESFKSTLEETVHADVLIHVIDSSSLEHELQRKVVLEILSKLDAVNKPIITAYNKIDLINEEEIIPYPDEKWVKISAKNNINLDLLLNEIKSVLPEKYIEFECIIPYNEGKILNIIHENGIVNSEEYLENGIKIKASLSQQIYDSISKSLGL